ncbi:mammalian ependymin-related protein 1-like [Mya arenaria]|uniref:mammalian ependymin-related protein 1-like n=1 Tax=Mya arenaria TaxID=6604 RepID=UPI0022E7E5A7|nr:mammalian ependymin-related protein 1-like [Mya arenaria]
MFFALLVFTLAAVSWAQVPTPCQSPKQFECRRFKTDRYKEFAEYEGYAYDETNKRTRSIEEIEAGREREIYDILRLYNSNQEYRVNLRTKQCNMTTIDHPFRMKGVPPGSKFLFESVLGAAGIPGEFITAQTFSGAFEDGAQYVVTVTTPDCVPIIFNIESNKTDEHYEDRFFDLKLGIADPDAFLPPSECSKEDI